ncbi:MAG: hypothetical protein ACKVQV_10185 [Bacteroidia bacterium]
MNEFLLLFNDHFFINLPTYGDTLKVISPTMLVEEVKKMYQKAFERYSYLTCL